MPRSSRSLELPRGQVSGVLLKPERHAPMRAVEAAQVRARRGLVDDCHAQPLGPRQLLVARQEALDALDVSAQQVRANIAVRGLPESALDGGAVLEVGDARIRVTHVCEVCKVLRRYVDEETFRSLPRQRGSLAVCLRTGSFRVGDEVRVLPERFPEVPERVYERLAWVVARIPRGQVVSYADLMTLVGFARAYTRVLPTYLKRAAREGLPAHRVLDSACSVTRHLPDQASRLAAEGVVLNADGALVGEDHMWDASDLYFRRRWVLDPV